VNRKIYPTHLFLETYYLQNYESLLENENYIELIENFLKGWQSEKLKYSLLDRWEIGKK
jgi:hypothetical protein